MSIECINDRGRRCVGDLAQLPNGEIQHIENGDWAYVTYGGKRKYFPVYIIQGDWYLASELAKVQESSENVAWVDTCPMGECFNEQAKRIAAAHIKE